MSIYQLIRMNQQEDISILLQDCNDLAKCGQSMSQEQLLLLKNAIKAMTLGWSQKADQQFDELNQSINPYDYEDLIQGLLPTENQSRQLKYAFACMLEGDRASRVLVGLMILEQFVVSDKTLKSVVETLAEWSVLTACCVRIIKQWPEKEDVFYRLAQHAHGTVRDMALVQLEGIGQTIRDFLLFDALEPDSSDRAIESVLKHAGIIGYLNQSMPHDIYGAIGRIFFMASYAGVEVDPQWLDRWVQEGFRQILDPTDYGYLVMIKKHAVGLTADTDHLIEMLLENQNCKETMAEVMKYGQGFETAKAIGLSYHPYLMDAIRRKPMAYTQWFEEMMKDPAYQSEMQQIIKELNNR